MALENFQEKNLFNGLLFKIMNLSTKARVADKAAAKNS